MGTGWSDDMLPWELDGQKGVHSYIGHVIASHHYIVANSDLYGATNDTKNAGPMATIKPV